MKEFEYKVSVIVPVYNVEEYLPECLDSLCNQTIDKKDLEGLKGIEKDYGKRFITVRA
mgnify:CR=1 FL=1